jgi:hypothetical protein
MLHQIGMNVNEMTEHCSTVLLVRTNLFDPPDESLSVRVAFGWR